MVRVGVIGTGFIGKGLAIEIERQEDIDLTHVLTRRDLKTIKGYPYPDVLTNDVNRLLEDCDIVVECSGDVLYGTEVIDLVMKAKIPVVTMNAELQVTTGSYFARRGFITEAEGDQPGCLAALHEEVIEMGFKPLVYGNIKGFLNLNPSLKDMQFYSQKNGLRLEMTTSFTDGTKVQIEQALVANGLGANIAIDGLIAPKSSDLNKTASKLAETAKLLDHPISDFVIAPTAPPGVFITATHDARHKRALSYYKMGDGPNYTLIKNYHLCHLEIMKTIRRVINGGTVLLNNGKNPTINVVAIAKKTLRAGEVIRKGIGSFQVRGETKRLVGNEDFVPIGLLVNARLKRKIEEGQAITFDDVEMPDSLALTAWRETINSSVVKV